MVRSDARVLVTGSSGFIGKSLVEYLEVDNAVLGLGRSGLVSSLNHPSLDVSISANALQKIIDFSPTHIIHCAGFAHKNSSRNVSSLSQLVSANISLTLHLASLSKRIGLKRFVFISTIGVHGSLSLANQPITESSVISPSCYYSQSKYLAELLLRDSLSGSACELSIIRPSLVYGRGMPGNLRALVKAVDAGFIFPFAGLHNIRSFLALDNLLSAIEHIAFHPSSGGESYVVADSEVISTPSFIRAIASARRKRLNMFYLPPTVLNTLCCFPVVGPKLNKLVSSLVVDSTKLSNLKWTQPITQAEAIESSFGC